MRTTITLDEDIARRVQQEMRRTGRSFKQTVNEAIRVGLSVRPSRSRKTFRVNPRPLGVRPGISYDNVAELLEQVEGPFGQ